MIQCMHYTQKYHCRHVWFPDYLNYVIAASFPLVSQSRENVSLPLFVGDFLPIPARLFLSMVRATTSDCGMCIFKEHHAPNVEMDTLQSQDKYLFALFFRRGPRMSNSFPEGRKVHLIAVGGAR